MNDVKTFEDLEVWKRGCNLAVDVHVALAESKDFALRGQMERSSLSIPSNIAEGAERVREVVVDEEPLARRHERAAAADQAACGIRRTHLNAQRAARNAWMAQRGEQLRALRRAGTARHGAAWTRAG